MPTSRATNSTRFTALMAAACWTILNPHPVLSQTADRISTDRPDFVEAAATVGKGRIQVETGVGLSDMSFAGIDVTTWTTPTLIRVGVSEVLELRLESDWLVREEETSGAGPSSTVTGIADVSLGVKWHLRDQDGGAPAMAVLVHADVPTGSDDTGSSGTRPSLRVTGGGILGMTSASA